MKAIFEVTDSEAGKVYAGNNFMQASTAYSRHVKASERGGGASVVMTHNGAIKQEFVGKIARETDAENKSRAEHQD